MRMYCRNRYAVISISSPGIPYPRGFAGAQPRAISRNRSAVGSRLLHDRSAVGSRLLHDRSAVGLRYFLVGFNLSFNNPGNSRVSLATGTPTDSNALILPSAEPEPPEMMAPA